MKCEQSKRKFMFSKLFGIKHAYDEKVEKCKNNAKYKMKFNNKYFNVCKLHLNRYIKKGYIKLEDCELI